tara:strand:- start:36 stop:1655 length:1620 start_codon:yes stop_codon:yes gene_type:complete
MLRRKYILIIFFFSSIVHGQNSLSQETEVLAKNYRTEIIIFLHRDVKSKNKEIFDSVVPHQEFQVENQTSNEETRNKIITKEEEIDGRGFTSTLLEDSEKENGFEADETKNSSFNILQNESISNLFLMEDFNVSDLKQYFDDLEKAIISIEKVNLGDVYKVRHSDGKIINLYKKIDNKRALNIEKIGSNFLIKIVDQPNHCIFDESKPTMISQDNLELKKEFEYLYNSNFYDPLLHFSWNESIYSNEEKNVRPLCSFVALPTNVKGNLTLYLSRYLHLDINIQINEPSEKISIKDLSDNLQELKPITHFIKYQINEDRILRNEELHYFDHPKIGVLAKVSRIENEALEDSEIIELVENNMFEVSEFEDNFDLEGFEIIDLEENTDFESFEIVQGEGLEMIELDNVLESSELIAGEITEESMPLSFEVNYNENEILDIHIKYNQNVFSKISDQEPVSNIKSSENSIIISQNDSLNSFTKDHQIKEAQLEDLSLIESNENDFKELFYQNDIDIDQLVPIIEELKNIINKFKSEINEISGED